jgi:hypothetical protein
MKVLGLSVEGRRVGLELVGFVVGPMETDGFKDREGLNVGPAAVGFTVGCFFPVGVRVAAKDGISVGLKVGKGVGLGEGWAVG